MKNITTKINKLLGPFGFLLLILMILQLIFVHFSGVHYFKFIIRDVWRILQSFISVIAIFLIIKNISGKSLWFSYLLQSLFILLYSALVGYVVKTKQSFEYSIIADNFNEIFYFESLSVIFNGLDTTPIWFALIGIIVIIFFQIKKKADTSYSYFLPKKMLILLAGLYLLFASDFVIQYDETVNLFRSIYYHYRPTTNNIDFESIKTEYPFLIEEPNRSASAVKQPHVFLIMIESFNAGVINKRNIDGKEYTPFFNELMSSGRYIEHFYGNSIQTAKGHFASLFSMVPLYKGKVFREYADNNFVGLADCLSQTGYYNTFINGQYSSRFDNVEYMMLNHGFDTYLPGKDLIPKSETDAWGTWGIVDAELYRSIFKYLDNSSNKDSPQFITITPTFHHVPFSIPKEKRELYKNPSAMEKRYANSVRFVDNGLKVFFEELDKRPEFENSLIIITGDHAYPIGDHGIIFNEVGYYEQSFRTPCLIIWKNHIIPQIDSTNTFSQIDIAPTILNAINAMPQSHHFQGQNMLSENPKDKLIYLVQPYNGTILACIDNSSKEIFCNN
jgi:phosphoglycerol transferase MdoB-like AlkP superfamily enzyme